MNNDFEQIGTGYLYNLWNGTLKEYRGEVLYKIERGVRYGMLTCREVTHFIVRDKDGRSVKRLCCSCVEGEVCNKTVWLSEADRAKAASIFIEYEKQRIAELQFQIKNHEELIDSLKNEMKKAQA